MKRLSLYLFLIFFTLQTPSQADDISDFQIEGMSIGDSLLEFMTKNQIDKLNKQYVYPNKEHYVFLINNRHLKLNIYDFIQTDIKNNDYDYIIVSMSGFLDFRNKINECHKKRKKIDSDIKLGFKNLSIKTYNKKHRSDETKKSINYITEFNFQDGDSIVTICEDWSTHMEKKRYTDRLRVGIMTKKFNDWIVNEAYK